ncbi:MAG: hypothetical protein GF401_04805 [Chitinivibrionales bacterium]|nr:hypothetical protein [Chitinivibrionales bacterium]
MPVGIKCINSALEIVLHMKNLKFILLLLLSFSVLFAQKFPNKPSGPVADYANVIDAGTEQKISSIAQALWDQAGFALVVATVPTLDVDETWIEDYTNKLYESWGIGAKGKDEGALVFLSLDPRKVRIEVGYGAEGYINDAKAGRILDTYGVPLFKQGDYSQGFITVSAALAQVIAEEKNISLTMPQQYRVAQRPVPQSSRGLSLGKLILMLIAGMFLIGTPFGRGILMGMLLSGLLGGGRRSHGGFGGGFGGGGFGGGFGGGMSGGGGATRGF